MHARTLSINVIGTFLLLGLVDARRVTESSQKLDAASSQNVQAPVVYFDGGTDADFEMAISRQKAPIYKGPLTKYTFTSDQLHKEFLIEHTEDEEEDGGANGNGRRWPWQNRGRPADEKKVCNEVLFVRKGDGKMCGTGLFTKNMLTCDGEITSETVDNWIKGDGKSLLPPSDRGFGVEFEFVARDLSRTQRDKLRSKLANDYGHGRAATMLRRPMANIMGIAGCFNETLLKSRNAGCSKFTDCSLNDFCRKDGTCDDRLNCRQPSDSKDRVCPDSLAHWGWHSDISVRPLSRREAAAIGAKRDETSGVAFEVTAPAPPHVLSGVNGIRSMAEVLAVLRTLGIQAGPSSGMHVHVNVMNDKVPGKKLTPERVAAVWAAYAKYQLVIDEMLSPNRPDNMFSNRLFLGQCEPSNDPWSCDRNPCGCTRRIWNNMFEWLKKENNGTALNFCNAALAMSGSSAWCTHKYPHQRYFQVNLAALDKFGTIEFRAHSATYDHVRITRWVQFLVGFVDYFGNGQGFRKMNAFFKAATADKAYAALRKAQREATVDELFNDLQGLVDKGTKEYFASRTWEQDAVTAATCNPRNYKPRTVLSSCAYGPQPPQNGGDDDTPDYEGKWSWLLKWTLRQVFRTTMSDKAPSPGPGTHAVLMSQNGTERTMRVKVPSGMEPGEYLDVRMPEGNIRAEMLDENSIEQGFHEFTDDLEAEEFLNSELRSA